MKIGIIGLPGAGKSTVTSALSGGAPPASGRGGLAIVTAKVPDPRVDKLSAMFNPKKTTHAKIEYLVPQAAAGLTGEGLWTDARNCDALIQVVRNFGPDPDPAGEIKKLGSDMVFADFAVLEKRAERLAADRKRGKDVNDEEAALIRAAMDRLEADEPLRLAPEVASAPIFRGFGLLSAKPILYLVNNEEDDDKLPEVGGAVGSSDCMVVRAAIESEIAGMGADEAGEFLAEYGITESALDRIIRRSYELVGLISFFTVGEDEVRAWTIRRETAAVDAAEEIHSDIKKGFIRAEVVAYEDFMAAGSMTEAKKLGKVRLEGKTYVVQDGDIINFRFNV